MRLPQIILNFRKFPQNPHWNSGASGESWYANFKFTHFGGLRYDPTATGLREISDELQENDRVSSARNLGWLQRLIFPKLYLQNQWSNHRQSHWSEDIHGAILDAAEQGGHNQGGSENLSCLSARSEGSLCSGIGVGSIFQLSLRLLIDSISPLSLSVERMVEMYRITEFMLENVRYDDDHIDWQAMIIERITAIGCELSQAFVDQWVFQQSRHWSSIHRFFLEWKPFCYKTCKRFWPNWSHWRRWISIQLERQAPFRGWLQLC